MAKKKKIDLLCVADICMPKDLVDFLGWSGAFAILAAYAATSFGYIGTNDPTYQGLNLFGAIGIIMSSLPRKAYQSVVLNVVWTVIAIGALLKMILGI